MNVLDLQEMLAGIVRTLDEEVGPHVATGAARAQFYSSLDLLNNLSSKLDWKLELLQAETESIDSALETALGAFAEYSGLPERLAAALEAARERRVQAASADEGVTRCRLASEALELVIEGLGHADSESAQPAAKALQTAREAVRQHLVNQTIRDSMFLKPMMLKKISQG